MGEGRTPGIGCAGAEAGAGVEALSEGSDGVGLRVSAVLRFRNAIGVCGTGVGLGNWWVATSEKVLSIRWVALV
jgi:hypothetical protein